MTAVGHQAVGRRGPHGEWFAVGLMCGHVRLRLSVTHRVVYHHGQQVVEAWWVGGCVGGAKGWGKCAAKGRCSSLLAAGHSCPPASPLSLSTLRAPPDPRCPHHSCVHAATRPATKCALVPCALTLFCSLRLSESTMYSRVNPSLHTWVGKWAGACEKGGVWRVGVGGWVCACVGRWVR